MLSTPQVDEEERVTLIDFPQMVSTRHANAVELFARDVSCIGRFFRKKLGYMPELDPGLASAEPDFEVRVVSTYAFEGCFQLLQGNTLMQLSGAYHRNTVLGAEELFWIIFDWA